MFESLSIAKDMLNAIVVCALFAVLAGCSGGGSSGSSAQVPGDSSSNKGALATCIKGASKSSHYLDVIQAYRTCGGKSSSDEFAKFMQEYAKVTTENGKLVVRMK